MFHGLWLIMALILAVSLSCTLWSWPSCHRISPVLWSLSVVGCAHLPKGQAAFSMGRDFHNAWRFYRSRLTGKPPVFL